MFEFRKICSLLVLYFSHAFLHQNRLPVVNYRHPSHIISTSSPCRLSLFTPSSMSGLFYNSNRNSRLNVLPVVQSTSSNDNNNSRSANNNDDNNSNPILSKLRYIIPAVGLVGIGYYLTTTGTFKSFDTTGFLESTVAKIASLGPLGYLYFALVYIAAEVLAIPVMPLTASSGYLFGLLQGSLLVLTSATIAACISFFIGRTFLRDWARQKTAGNQLWKMVDTAVGREGFKIILLLRLSPLLPFAISNYLYGITSVDFGSYFLATLLGFAPGSIGIVYAGSAGKALFDQHGGSLPWYLYLGIGILIFAGGKTIAKIASDTIKQVQLEEEQEQLKAKNNSSGSSSGSETSSSKDGNAPF